MKRSGQGEMQQGLRSVHTRDRWHILDNQHKSFQHQLAGEKPMPLNCHRDGKSHLYCHPRLGQREQGFFPCTNAT